MLGTQLLLLVHLIPELGAAGSIDRPNILFLFADDQRADTIGATGKPFEKIDLTGRTRTPDQWQPEWIVKKYF